MGDEAKARVARMCDDLFYEDKRPAMAREHMPRQWGGSRCQDLGMNDEAGEVSINAFSCQHQAC
jgi:hypothetical protein